MTGVRCMLLRGGTSKGAYFVADDLPQDAAERDELLLRIMGSPDARQIDGLGGAHPLTSKVAVVSASDDGVDYLFLQVGVEQATVSDRQNCGNLLAGVGPFAILRGLVRPTGDVTHVRIAMRNTGGHAVAHVPTPGGVLELDGDTAIDGVPGTAAAIVLDFEGTAGSTCGALLPTGSVVDVIDGVEVTCLDNGMPVVLVRGADLGVRGDESPADLEGDARLAARVERIRLDAGARMGLGDVTGLTVPKVALVAAPRGDATLATRMFIPHRVHQSIGVLAAATVGAAVLVPGSVAAPLARVPDGPRLRLEHPTGALEVEVELKGLDVRRTAAVRTARPILDGVVFARPRR